MIKEMEIKMYKFDNTLFGKAVKKKRLSCLDSKNAKVCNPCKGEFGKFLIILNQYMLDIPHVSDIKLSFVWGTL